MNDLYLLLDRFIVPPIRSRSSELGSYFFKVVASKFDRLETFTSVSRRMFRKPKRDVAQYNQITAKESMTEYGPLLTSVSLC
jgi:hypothetical protein